MRKRKRLKKKKNIDFGKLIGYTYMLSLLSVIIIFIWSFIDTNFSNKNRKVQLLTTGVEEMESFATRPRISIQNGCATSKLASRYRSYLLKNHKNKFDFFEAINVPDERIYNYTTILFNNGFDKLAYQLGEKILMVDQEHIVSTNKINNNHLDEGPDITIILGLDYITLKSHKLFAQDNSFRPN
tara:strand:- start:186 stop:737 length:552 start_codon:yes stop_codon:yes gene_type:complete